MSRESKKKLILSDRDAVQIRKLLQAPDCHNQEYISALRSEIEDAEIVSYEKLPSDVVIMNSNVRILDTDTMESVAYTLVYPWDANADESKISVLAPVGTALLGYREGDKITWNVPAGVSAMKIMSVKQPVPIS